MKLMCDRCGREAQKLACIDGTKKPDRDADGVVEGGVVDNCAEVCGRCYRAIWMFIFKRP